jgi:vacuolar-type H+-ATPase subunit H
MYKSVDSVFKETKSVINIFASQLKPGTFTPLPSPPMLQEGMENENYATTMIGVQQDLEKISKAEYQRERLMAITDESNKQLISQSYKFILWSILAILVVLALIKLKETFGQDEVDEDSGEGGGGGILASILALFSIGKVDTSDIADKTGEVKAGLASAGEQLMQATEQLSTNITEGADNLVSSANDAADNAVESAKGFADKVSETAADTINKVGDAMTNSGDKSATTPMTGGKKRKHKNK